MLAVNVFPVTVETTIRSNSSGKYIEPKHSEAVALILQREFVDNIYHLVKLQRYFRHLNLLAVFS